MNSSVKVIVVILVVVAIAGGGIGFQMCSSSPKVANLSKHDMEVIFHEILGPQQQQEVANNAEEKKKLVTSVKQMLALAHKAEQEGYAEKPEIVSQASFQADLVMNQSYRKKNPDVKVADDEINAYHTAHPKDFDDFMQSDPRFQAQAQGPQRDKIRHEFGEFKVIADRARKEKLDQDDVTRIRLLLARTQTLAGAYMTDLQKNADQLVTDADVEAYFGDHASEFDEVRVRHILISTQPPPPGSDDKDAPDKETPKPLTKEEARKKAQGLLDRARKGEDFAKLATENSDDRGSKDKGGEYDFFGKGRMVPEFEAAAFALKPGEISDLVETQFGIHIIKLEERRAAASPTGDPKVKQQIVEKLKQDKIDEKVKQIADSSPVVVPEDFDTTPKAAESQAIPGVPNAGQSPDGAKQ